MTDLTNRNIEEANILFEKYKPVLEVSNIRNIEDAKILAIVYDVSVKHIKENHNQLNIDWKAWCMVVVNKLFLIKKFKTEEQIIKTIDAFVEYWKNEYQSYCNDLAMFASEYDRDNGFVFRYILKNR
jgi:hypothetical protein